MRPSFVIAAYVSIGIILCSELHTYYVGKFYDGIRFGLPVVEDVSFSMDHKYGYIGGALSGILAFATLYLFQEYNISSYGDLTLQTCLQQHSLPYLGLTILILLLDQFIAGASWSKLFLNIALLFVSYIVLLSFAQPLSFWNIISILVIGLGGLLGAAWNVWSSAFVTPRLKEIGVQSNPEGLIYPHFPTFAYFTITSVYIVTGALAVMIGYWRFA